MTTTPNNIPSEIINNEIVKVTIYAIRVMWDVRKEKDFYHSTNWLVGMNEDYSKVLSMLFGAYAYGHETTQTFAKRIANIK